MFADNDVAGQAITMVKEVFTSLSPALQDNRVNGG